MSHYMEGGGPGDGLFPGKRRVRCKNKTGEAVVSGDHVMLDLKNSVTGLSIIPGGAPGTSIWNTVVDPVVADAQVLPILVADEAVAVDADGWFTSDGIVTANVEAAVDAGASSFLVAAVDNRMDVSTGAAGERIIAKALSAAVANRATVWLFGGEPGNNDI